MYNTPITPETIIEFWFSERVKPLWFNSTPDFDAEVRERFQDGWREAKEGHLDHWQDNAIGALALIIILDQFPLNMYRGQSESFSTEAQARTIASNAIDRGFDQQLNDEQKGLLYIPFMHSEDPADQERSVALYEAMASSDSAKWAKHHRDIIRRFGRFPHRNDILGRESSKEEISYLASEEGFQG